MCRDSVVGPDIEGGPRAVDRVNPLVNPRECPCRVVKENKLGDYREGGQRFRRGFKLRRDSFYRLRYRRGARAVEVWVQEAPAE